MAIQSGVRTHAAWIEAAGQRFLLTQGTANLAATRESSTFSATVPMSLDNAEQVLAAPSDISASIIVMVGQQQGTLVTGELDGGEFDYETRSIHLTGRCKSADLHRKKTREKWTNKTPDAIIKDLAKRAGLQVQSMSLDLKAGRIWNTDWNKLTDNVSYAHAIQKMCEMMGAQWWVDPQGVMHVEDHGTMGSYSIYYDEPGPGPAQSDALSINVSKNYQAGKTVKVTVKSWNQKKKKVYTGTKSVNGKGGTLDYEYEIPELTQDHVDNYAEKKSQEHGRHEIMVSATCAGDPTCIAGMQLSLNGTPFAGTYDIDAVDHTFGMGGYTMTIHARGRME